MLYEVITFGFGVQHFDKQNVYRERMEEIMRLKRHIDLHIVALIWCAVTVVPLIFTVLSSFKTTIQIYQNPFSLPESVDWFNFTTAIEKGSILSAIGNSFFLALATVVFVVLIASMAAFIVARNDGSYNFV